MFGRRTRIHVLRESTAKMYAMFELEPRFNKFWRYNPRPYLSSFCDDTFTAKRTELVRMHHVKKARIYKTKTICGKVLYSTGHTQILTQDGFKMIRDLDDADIVYMLVDRKYKATFLESVERMNTAMCYDLKCCREIFVINSFIVKRDLKRSL